MKTRMKMTSAVAIALACVASLHAHHSISMFDLSTPIWVKGTVVRLDRMNPHSVMLVEEKKPGGQVQRWTIEGPSAQRLGREGVPQDVLKAGDVIELCAFVLKAEHVKPTSPVSDASSRFVHGHLLVLPDGHMRIWGSYGKLQNCIRPGDQQQSWLDFVNANPGARDNWCNKFLESIPTSASSRAIVKEISSRMANPC